MTMLHQSKERIFIARPSEEHHRHYHGHKGTKERIFIARPSEEHQRHYHGHKGKHRQEPSDLSDQGFITAIINHNRSWL